MAGYVGTKAVLLSTTAANVGGDADIGGALDVGGAFTSQGIDDNATSTAMTLDASGNVGIGTTQQAHKLSLEQSNKIGWVSTVGTDKAAIEFSGTDDSLRFYNNTGSTERMRIDSSGNLLVGTTSTATNDVGFKVFQSTGQTVTTASNTNPVLFNRKFSNGDVAIFRKDDATVGSIGAKDGNLVIGTGDTGFRFISGIEAIIPQNISTNAGRDNAIDLGHSSTRFDDIYATNPNINTSDRNEKQDIEVLSDAETRVAQACKGLLRKFRWRDAVAEKGDEARTHFGIIAQDLHAAFAAEGLDAGRYAMFISTTWWETQTEVPAVEAVAEVLDEEGNVVTEAVEAVDAYTRTDTYETQEEAPEGATERTRLGVRYSELLAFIIGAL